jgi:hypothetical protein
MSAYEFGHPMVKRAVKDKPKLKPIKIYFNATVVCPDCCDTGDVVLNKDAEYYHECNEGNVRAELPKIEMPMGIVKHLHKNKLISNLKYLELINEQNNK